MSKDKSEKNWFGRHKILSGLGVLIILGVIISAASGGKSNTQTVPNSNSSDTTQSTTQQPAQEKMTISNSSYSDSNGLKQVVGEIKNNDSGKHSATIKATFYDAANKILGTASGAVNDVAPGETKTFTLITGDDVTGYANMKVQIDTLL